MDRFGGHYSADHKHIQNLYTKHFINGLSTFPTALKLRERCLFVLPLHFLSQHCVISGLFPCSTRHSIVGSNIQSVPGKEKVPKSTICRKQHLQRYIT